MFDKLFPRESLLVKLLAVLVTLMLLAPAQALAAPGVAVDISANVIGTYTGANALGTPAFGLTVRATNRFTAGVTAQKADKLYSDTRTLAASATENLDLAGSMLDPFGAAFTPAKVKAIYVRAAAANTNNVCVGGHASAAFLGPFSDATDIVCIRPGGIYLVTAPATGWSVTATTADMLKVANSSSGTGVTYDIIIVGTSS